MVRADFSSETIQVEQQIHKGQKEKHPVHCRLFFQKWVDSKQFAANSSPRREAMETGETNTHAKGQEHL